MNNRFRIVAIDVKDRGANHFRHVRRIWRGARESRRCCKTDLVIDDKVDGPAARITPQTGKTQTFCDNTLPGERGVAMQKKRDDIPAQRSFILLLQTILLRARLAQDNRIDRFKVRRVCGQRQVHPVAVEFAI